MWLDRFDATIIDLLDAALSLSQGEDRQGEVLNGAAVVLMYATHLSDNGRKAGDEAGSFALGTAPSIMRTCFTSKRGYGFFRARYLGMAKADLEYLLNTLAFNLKRRSSTRDAGNMCAYEAADVGSWAKISGRRQNEVKKTHQGLSVIPF